MKIHCVYSDQAQTHWWITCLQSYACQNFGRVQCCGKYYVIVHGILLSNIIWTNYMGCFIGVRKRFVSLLLKYYSLSVK